jgi:hypothetical protein
MLEYIPDYFNLVDFLTTFGNFFFAILVVELVDMPPG